MKEVSIMFGSFSIVRVGGRREALRIATSGLSHQEVPWACWVSLTSEDYFLSKISKTVVTSCI